MANHQAATTMISPQSIPTAAFVLWIGYALLFQDARAQIPIDTPEQRAAILNDEGVKAYDAERYAEAIDRFDLARVLDPKSEVLSRNLARALHARTKVLVAEKRVREAVSDLQRAIALDPEEWAFPVRLADIQREQGEPEEARRVLQKALAKNPGKARLHEALGRLEYEEDRIVEALALLETALKLDGEEGERLKTLVEKVRREAEIEKEYFRDVSGIFTVKYDDKDFREVGGEVLRLLSRHYDRLGNDFQAWPERRISVVLYTRGDYDLATGAQDWTGGLFDGKIRLPVRNFRAARREIESTLVHELTHLFVRQVCRNCPLWLNEGLAQIQEGKRYVPSPLADLRKLHADRLLPKISELSDHWASLKDHALVSRNYAMGLSFTSFLLERGGWRSVRSLFARIAGGEEFSRAFELEFGRTLNEADQLWRAGL